MSNSISKKILIYGSITCCLLSFFNTLQEGGGWLNSIPFAMLGTLPFIATFLWVLFAKKISEGIKSFTSASVLIFGIFAYVMYLHGGQANPNTAGHMHIFLFPILHFLFALALILIMHVFYLGVHLTKKITKMST